MTLQTVDCRLSETDRKGPLTPRGILLHGATRIACVAEAALRSGALGGWEDLPHAACSDAEEEGEHSEKELIVAGE